MGQSGPLDNATFYRLYDSHVGFVQFVAKKAGWTNGAVDDVVQETFLRLHQSPPQSYDDRAVRAWLATTARRVMIDWARRSGREQARLDPGDEGTASALWFRDPESLERELEIMAVREIVEEVAAMPGGADFRAYYVEGLKAREIAAKSGEAVSTVTSRLSRLRNKFRERFLARLNDIRASSA